MEDDLVPEEDSELEVVEDSEGDAAVSVGRNYLTVAGTAFQIRIPRCSLIGWSSVLTWDWRTLIG